MQGPQHTLLAIGLQKAIQITFRFKAQMARLPADGAILKTWGLFSPHCHQWPMFLKAMCLCLQSDPVPKFPGLCMHAQGSATYHSILSLNWCSALLATLDGSAIAE